MLNRKIILSVLSRLVPLLLEGTTRVQFEIVKRTMIANTTVRILWLITSSAAELQSLWIKMLSTRSNIVSRNNVVWLKERVLIVGKKCISNGKNRGDKIVLLLLSLKRILMIRLARDALYEICLINVRVETLSRDATRLKKL